MKALAREYGILLYFIIYFIVLHTIYSEPNRLKRILKLYSRYFPSVLRLEIGKLFYQKGYHRTGWESRKYALILQDTLCHILILEHFLYLYYIFQKLTHVSFPSIINVKLPSFVSRIHQVGRKTTILGKSLLAKAVCLLSIRQNLIYLSSVTKR